MTTNDIILIDTNECEPPKEDNDIFKSRSNVSNLLQGEKSPLVSILIIAYNRIEKTKQCIESVIKYTSNVDYELILVDNGSFDDTLEYFRSVEHIKKKIIKITKNMQLSFGILKAYKYCSGKYIAFLNNDMIVTRNWLNNIIKCFQSDEKIGLVCNMSSNVSNLQQADIHFSSIEEMQAKASEYNISNPRKWHERLRLITAGAVYKSECIDICGNWDYGFFHDFADDDLAFHIRRAGYKTILCKDVFVHHDHVSGTGKNAGELKKSIEKGRENFKKKYYGIDPWDDVNNYEIQMIDMVKQPKNKKDIKILGIDVKCGTPALEIKNKLREFDILDAEISAFTEGAKYYLDLCTICQGKVECDRIDYISEYFENEQFDYIILGKALNLYSEPFKLLLDCTSMLKRDGQLLIKLRNVNDLQSLLQILGNNETINDEYIVNWTVEDLNKWILRLGFSINDSRAENYSLDIKSNNRLTDIVQNSNLTKDVNGAINRMKIKNHLLSIIKADR